MFDALMADRQAIPAASPANGRPTVALPALDAAKIALYTAMRDAKVNKAELRRRLRTHPPQVDRLLKMRHASKLDLLEQAFAAVGKRLVLSFEDLPQATTPAGARTPTRRRARGRPARVRRRHRAARA
jgi:antitoxin HicB